MHEFLKKKFNFAQGGIRPGTDIKVNVEQGEWIIPMKAMRYMLFLATLNRTKNIRFVLRNAVAVTRCKDCEWWGKAGCAISIVDDSDRPKENDFCSFAERKRQ